MRIVSGIKPSGRPHIGNYLGALRQHIALQNGSDKCIFFVADYHALTTLRNAEELKAYRRGVVLDYLALGLDPNKVTFFYQSDVPEHAELQWILSTVTNPGLLERAHAWKDAKENNLRDINAGLYMYPVLMAADILIYNANKVPVGKDQKQHIEIARDIAISFNSNFGETFVLPDELVEDKVATVLGTDGRKMSKSYNNTISIFAEEETIRKQVMSIKTDSIDIGHPMPTKDDIILGIFEQFSSTEEYDEMLSNYKAGGYGYGNAKQALLNKLLAHFESARKKREELEVNANIDEIMNEGAKSARLLAKETMEKVYSGTGLK